MNWYRRFITASNEFGWCYVDVPSKLTAKIHEFQKSIDPKDFAEDGLEKESHITLKYGIHTLDESEVKDAVEGEKGGVARLGVIDIFDNEDADVLKVTIKSKDLSRLNKCLTDALKCTDEHEDEYKAHLTIAYLKKGTGRKYMGDNFVGEEFSFNEIYFGDKNDKNYTIKLGG